MAKRGRPRKNPLPDSEGNPSEGGRSTTVSGYSPPATAVRDYDDLVRELRDLEEMTGTRGWARFYGDLQSARDGAKISLLSAEKMVEVVKAQATVHLVEEQIKRLTEPVTRINEMREKYPLFKCEFTYTGKLDLESGRVTLVHKSVKNGTTQDAAAAAEPGVSVTGVEAEPAVNAEAATDTSEGAEGAQPDADTEGTDTATAGTEAANAEGGETAGVTEADGGDGDEEGDNEDALTDDDEPAGDDDPFGE